MSRDGAARRRVLARPRRASAALVLGFLAGALASVTYLPTLVPLTLRLVDAEGAIALRHASWAALAVTRSLQQGGVVTPATANDVGVHSLRVRTADGLELYTIGPQLPDALLDRLCDAATPDLVQSDGDIWAVSCLEGRHHQVVAAFVPDFATGADVILLVVALAIIVGIITALGILSLLRPLSQVTSALARVEAGERGVRVATTGLKELDDLVERLNAAARSVELREDAVMARIRVVQEMARLVAHEIRNPLQSLEILTTLVASEDDPKERQEVATSIHNEIRALDRVVQRLLREGASTGALRLQRSPQPLAPLVDQIVALCQPEARAHGVRIVVGLMSWRPVPIDSTLIGRSIENLVVNGLQAVSPDGGEVRISVYEEPPWLCLAVDDNGPGVDPALRDHIFEADVTTKASGSGLGLSLVKGVVEAHGGSVTVTPSALGGARFVLRLPLEVPDGDHVASTDSPQDLGR